MSKYVAIAAVLMLIPLLAGCASSMSEPRDEVCYMQSIGRTNEGWTVVAQRCLTPEAFTESQK